MNLPKILTLLCLSVILNKLQAQTHTFLAEIDLGMGYFGGTDKASYDHFLRKYFVKIYKANGTQLGEEIKSVKIIPKEDWYTKFSGDRRKVELIIEIPNSLLPNSKGVVVDDGSINIYWELWSRKSRITKASNFGKDKTPLYISWNKKDSTDITYINKTTFKFRNPIFIGAPAEVGLDLSLEYLKIALDSTSDDVPQLRHTVAELETLLKKSKKPFELSYVQFRDFSKLLLFLEPYVSENSFLNKEASELSQNIRALRDSLDISKDLIEVDKYRIDSIQGQLSTQLELFSDYQTTISRVRNYYSELQLILYGRLYSLRSQNTDSTFKIKSDLNRINFALGSLVSLGFQPLYNVTLSPGDTVQFESVSRVNAALSAGLFWTVPLVQKKVENSDSNFLRHPPTFNAGLIVNYSIIPNSSQLPSTNPLGFGLALGCRIQNFGFFLSGNLKLVRQPRQYFIDQYKDKDLTRRSLDLNDNQTFLSKTYITFGLSLMYFLDSKQ